ncbi:LANO_0C09296g1_1 [Lachancea nothofagi CBS 11611]|uniref:LANO_0C09296g1_1 n=1 Tax=Lachancea nothofagi CBS 11611 TaxID=1266666 RepID=A0A1G4JA50_9SACH|nr:LANO_0C09296g1_1 [Lachancea nothofagi CBS 11611]
MSKPWGGRCTHSTAVLVCFVASSTNVTQRHQTTVKHTHTIPYHTIPYQMPVKFEHDPWAFEPTWDPLVADFGVANGASPGDGTAPAWLAWDWQPSPHGCDTQQAQELLLERNFLLGSCNPARDALSLGLSDYDGSGGSGGGGDRVVADDDENDDSNDNSNNSVTRTTELAHVMSSSHVPSSASSEASPTTFETAFPLSSAGSSSPADSPGHGHGHGHGSKARRSLAAAAAAAKSSRHVTGRSHSWSASASSVSRAANAPSAPLYKYVAHAQMAMQYGQPKNSLENKRGWLRIARITPERHALIAQRLAEKRSHPKASSACEQIVSHVLRLFEQSHVREKIQLLALERRRRAHSTSTTTSELEALAHRDLDAANHTLWLNQRIPRNAARQAKQFPRLTVHDCDANASASTSASTSEATSIGSPPSLLAVEVRTSSGYNDYTAASTEISTLSNWDCDLLQLRHMSLLRESDDRRRKNKYYEFIEGKMKRPLNSFMLYRSALMKAVAILKVCNVVTETCQFVAQRYPQLTETQLLSVIRCVIEESELPLDLPVLIDLDFVAHAIQTTMYEPAGEDDYTDSNDFAANAGLKPVDPKFANQTDVAQVITLMWNTEPQEFKQHFVEFSHTEKQHHHEVYPKYKYCPIKKERTVRNLNTSQPPC